MSCDKKRDNSGRTEANAAGSKTRRKTGTVDKNSLIPMLWRPTSHLCKARKHVVTKDEQGNEHAQWIEVPDFECMKRVEQQRAKAWRELLRSLPTLGDLERHTVDTLKDSKVIEETGVVIGSGPNANTSDFIAGRMVAYAEWLDTVTLAPNTSAFWTPTLNASWVTSEAGYGAVSITSGGALASTAITGFPPGSWNHIGFHSVHGFGNCGTAAFPAHWGATLGFQPKTHLPMNYGSNVAVGLGTAHGAPTGPSVAGSSFRLGTSNTNGPVSFWASGATGNMDIDIRIITLVFRLDT